MTKQRLSVYGHLSSVLKTFVVINSVGFGIVESTIRMTWNMDRAVLQRNGTRKSGNNALGRNNFIVMRSAQVGECPLAVEIPAKIDHSLP